MKQIASEKDKFNNINENIKSTNNKIQAINNTKNSFNFFISIFVVVSILLETIKDFKDTKTSKRTISKSFKKTCERNASRISKIKF